MRPPARLAACLVGEPPGVVLSASPSGGDSSQRIVTDGPTPCSRRLPQGEPLGDPIFFGPYAHESTVARRQRSVTNVMPDPVHASS